MHTDEPVRLLTVCTGNICRSPYAEMRLRDRGHARRADRDVADPYARGDRAFDRMVAEVDPAVRSIVPWERQFAR